MLMHYFPQSPAGLFGNPDAERYLEVMFSAIMRELEALAERTVAAQNVTLTVPQSGDQDVRAMLMSLQEYLQPLLSGGENALIPPGTIVPYYGSLATARSLRHWRVADGTNGTPALLGLFLRWSSDGHDAGETGGTASHSHSGSLSIDYNSPHSHSLTGYTGSCGAHTHTMACTSCCTWVACGATCSVPAMSHTHGIDSAGAHTHTVCFSTDPVGGHSHTGSVSISGAAHLPPYYGLIPLMKL